MAAQVRCINTFSRAVISSGLGGSACYWEGHLLKAIDPMRGFAFGAVASIVDLAITPLVDRIFFRRGADWTANMLGTFVRCGVSASVSIGIFALFGMPIAFGTALSLSLNSVLVNTLISVINMCC